MSRPRTYDDSILVRTTQAEGRAIRQRARAARRSLSRFLAELGTQGADLPVPAPPPLLAVASGEVTTDLRDDAMLFHLRRVGANLNRLVVVANQGHVPNLTQLSQTLDQIQDLVRQIEARR